MKTKPTSPNGRVDPSGDLACENGGNNSSSPSPPPSPRRHQAAHQCRRRPPQRTKSQSFQRREGLSAGVFLRLNFRYLLVLPVLYISGLIMCVGPFSALVGQPYIPGSVYRSHKLLDKLWPDMEADANSSSPSSLQLSSVWKYKRRYMKVQKPCSNSTARQLLGGVEEGGCVGENPTLEVANGLSLFITVDDPPTHYLKILESSGAKGYLVVEANGGLNQQRSAICNAAAVAALLNAILVVPFLEYHKVWKDPSSFEEIYDTEHFIASLRPYVEVVKELPRELMETYDDNIANIPSMRIEAWAPANVYLREVYPALQKQRVVRISPFANRLAMHVPSHIQLLRCIANYKALKFSLPISSLADKLINRMIEKSSRTDGKYLSIHLRFEEDMVAFSCCVYDGGEAEKRYMDALRERGWKGKFKRKDRVIEPGLNRLNGQCPLTPLEVGLMLRGMGFDNTTAIYVASGSIYRAERYLAPLKKLFPHLYTKESLATPDELAPLEAYSSRMAALDYTVCLFSEVFVTTQGGNFPHFLMGHRRFLFDGHSKTIRPDKQKLVLLLQDMDISWKEFRAQMQKMLIDSDRNGLMVPRVRKINRKTSIYTYPLPECGCLQSQNTSLALSRISDQIST